MVSTEQKMSRKTDFQYLSKIRNFFCQNVKWSMDPVKYHAIKKSELKTRKIEQCAALHFVSYGEKS